MKKILFLIVLAFILATPFDGLALITTIGGQQNTSNTYLIDNDENIINFWSHSNGTASVGYLTRDSILFLPGKTIEDPDGIVGAPQGGLFKKIDWNNNIIWEWQMPDEVCEPHHDIALLPNGNFLVICEETKTQQEALNAGVEGINGPMILDMVVEVQPIGNDNAAIVWEWRFGTI